MKWLCEAPKSKYHVWNPHRVLGWIASLPKPKVLIPAGGEAAVLLMLATGARLSDILRLRATWKNEFLEYVFFLFCPRKTDVWKQFVAQLHKGFLPWKLSNLSCARHSLFSQIGLSDPPVSSKLFKVEGLSNRELWSLCAHFVRNSVQLR